ncbi:MAG: serine/threonine protein kinase [Planctomycetes bacterium]|nr:serine/threonine protein kinase [Planctomycetota bacterium]
MKAQDADDVRFAARLVLDGLLSQDRVQALIAKQKELVAADRPLTIAQMCVAKGWLSRSEARFLARPESPPAGLVPGFELLGFLGSGGMSQVYRARSLARGEEVALKVLKPQLSRDPRALARFRREAELLIELEHENIVKGHRFVEEDGLVAFSMELVPGQELLQLIDEGGPFQEDAALYVVLQIARALEAMHDRGVVHRDIKPGNILLTRDNTVKLCDLGLATGADGEADGTTVGTVEYISPEQALGEDEVDVRSDIYALGVSLYHLAVGEIPFQGEDEHETMGKRFFEGLDPAKMGRLSPHLHYFIQKMMARDREIRYQSPAELIEDIEEQIRGKKSLTVNPFSASADAFELERPFAPGEAAKPASSAPVPSRKRSESSGSLRSGRRRRR